MTAVRKLEFVDEPANWRNRSALVLSPGLWRMRNGHTANIEKRINIPYKDGVSGKMKVYAIWKGICVDCDVPMTWTINGCYAAVGRHQNDIVGPA
jgi:hypothetical protein